MQYTIEDHWDPGRIMNETSNALDEFNRWHAHACKYPDEWTGDEFSLEDFQEHIAALAGGEQ